MRSVGFDGIVFTRENLTAPKKTVTQEQEPRSETEEQPVRKYKAYLCASISTENEADFKAAYDEKLDVLFQKLAEPRKKRVYKAAHLTKQLEERADQFIPTFCDSLSDEIYELGIYFCYFDRPFISAYGHGHGARFHPIDFIEKNSELLLHVCAFVYANRSGRDDEQIQMDHFEAYTTPAWRELSKLRCKKEIYFSGCECNALISVADLVLRIIDWHQYGWVEPTSILQPIRDHLPQLSKKLKFYPVGKSNEDLKLLVPDLKLGVAKKEYLKHPVFFLLWNPAYPRKMARPAFEWSPIYNTTMSKAFDKSGCVKTFAGVEEHMYWNKDRDYLVSWSPAEHELVEDLKRMKFDLPPVLTDRDLGCAEAQEPTHT